MDYKNPEKIKMWAQRILSNRRRRGWDVRITTQELMDIATETPGVCPSCNGILVYGSNDRSFAPNICARDTDPPGGPPIIAKGTFTITCTNCERNLGIHYQSNTPRRTVHPLETAKQWLSSYLANGPQIVKEIIVEGNKLGISGRTIQRAKRLLGIERFAIVVKSTAGKETKWYWKLAGGDCTQAVIETEQKFILGTPQKDEFDATVFHVQPMESATS